MDTLTVSLLVRDIENEGPIPIPYDRQIQADKIPHMGCAHG